MSGAAMRPLGGRWSAVAALVMRDIAGRSRGATLGTARLLAVLVSSFAAVAAYAFGTTGVGIAPEGADVLFLGLGAVTVALAPALAVHALRREREAGTLDILLLAGLPPRAITLGRTASTFLLFESVLVSALPAIALFWFFRRPSPLALLLASVDFTAWSLALAGVVVVVSAWARSTGMAVVGTLVLAGSLFAWSASGEGTSALDVLRPAALSSRVIVGESAGSSVAAAMAPHAACLLAGLLAGLGLSAVAAMGLRRAAGAEADGLMERLEPRHRRAEVGRWPLTWLLHRSSAATRPLVQAAVAPLLLAVAFGPPAALALVGDGGARLADLFPPEILRCGAGALLGVGAAVALAVGAWQAPALRESRAWDSLLSTRLPGGRVLLDLWRAALVAAAVPTILGMALLLASARASDFPMTLAVAGAIAGALLPVLAATLGVAVSCRTTSVFGGLAAGGGALAAVLGWSAFASLALSRDVLDEMGSGSSWSLLAPGIAVAVATAGALALALGRGRPLLVLLGISALVATTVPAVVTATLPAEEKTIEALGAALLAPVLVQAPFDHGRPDIEAPALLGAAAYHALLTIAVGLPALRAADRWLGRAS